MELNDLVKGNFYACKGTSAWWIFRYKEHSENNMYSYSEMYADGSCPELDGHNGHGILLRECTPEERNKIIQYEHSQEKEWDYTSEMLIDKHSITSDDSLYKSLYKYLTSRANDPENGYEWREVIGLLVALETKIIIDIPEKSWQTDKINLIHGHRYVFFTDDHGVRGTYDSKIKSLVVDEPYNEMKIDHFEKFYKL